MNTKQLTPIAAMRHDIQERIRAGARDAWENEQAACEAFRERFRLTARQAAKLWHKLTTNTSNR